MIVYRTTDRVPVKIGDVTLIISPLGPSEKIRVAEKATRGPEQGKIAPLAYETLRIAVKDIEAPGFQFPDGSPITLERAPDGTLTDEGLAVLMQICDSMKLIPMACQLAARGISDWEIDGVEIVHPFPEKKTPEHPVSE